MIRHVLAARPTGTYNYKCANGGASGNVASHQMAIYEVRSFSGLFYRIKRPSPSASILGLRRAYAHLPAWWGITGGRVMAGASDVGIQARVIVASMSCTYKSRKRKCERAHACTRKV